MAGGPSQVRPTTKSKHERWPLPFRPGGIRRLCSFMVAASLVSVFDQTGIAHLAARDVGGREGLLFDRYGVRLRPCFQRHLGRSACSEMFFAAVTGAVLGSGAGLETVGEFGEGAGIRLGEDSRDTASGEAVLAACAFGALLGRWHGCVSFLRVVECEKPSLGKGFSGVRYSRPDSKLARRARVFGGGEIHVVDFGGNINFFRL